MEHKFEKQSQPGTSKKRRPRPTEAGKRQPRSAEAAKQPHPRAEAGTKQSPASKMKQAKPRHRFLKQTEPRFSLLLTLWLSVTIPELGLHIATASSLNQVFNSGLFLGPAFGLVSALAVYALIRIVNIRWFSKAATIVFALINFLFCSAQYIYFRIFDVFFSAFSMFNGGEAFQFWRTLVRQLIQGLPVLVILAIPLIFYLVWGRKNIRFVFTSKRVWALAAVALAIVLQIGLVGTLSLWGSDAAVSAYDLYHGTPDPFWGINRLGLATAFRLDIQRLITGADTEGSLIIETDPTEETTLPNESENVGTVTNPTSGPDETERTPEDPTEPITSQLNVLDIDFDSLIANTSNAKVRDMHKYFANRTPSHKNEKTGLFEGCNLIMICAEAWSDLIVDEVRTPTMYKLMHEGFYFTDYYVPGWGHSTTDGEYAFLTGTLPKGSAWSFAESAKNYMPLTMSRQLIEKGYSAYAYHGHTYDYYKRNQYLENLGFTYRAYGQGLPVEKIWPESDYQVVDLTTEDFVNDTPFVAYYMTISGHREFNFKDNMISYRNMDLVKDEPYSSNVKAYIACQLELEKALTLLLERLEEAGVLENTVIVMTADHNPNGLTKAQHSELLGHTVEPDIELYKNGLIIYKPGMTPETITSPCSHFDILPTLSNLFGLDFDSRLYMGRDVFSDAEPLVIFSNWSWITDKAVYNTKAGKVTSKTGETISKEYIRQISNEVSNRYQVSCRILENNYWKILFG